MLLSLRGKPNFSSSTHHIMIDGNSFVDGGNNLLASLVQSSSVLSGSGIAIRSLGIQGQTWQAMTSVHGDVDFYFVPGKTNILYTVEGTNSICNAGRTGLQAAADAGVYAAAVKAVHPEIKIFNVLTIPRRGVSYFGVAGANAELNAYDDEFKKNYKSLGFDGYVDLRPDSSSPFYLSTFTDAAFQTKDYLYNSLEIMSGNGAYTHPNPTIGMQVLASYIIQHLRRLG